MAGRKLMVGLVSLAASFAVATSAHAQVLTFEGVPSCDNTPGNVATA